MDENSKFKTEKEIVKFLGLEDECITRLTLELSVEDLPKLTLTRYLCADKFQQTGTVRFNLVLKENK